MNIPGTTSLGAGSGTNELEFSLNMDSSYPNPIQVDKSTLTWFERFIYWRAFRKARRKVIKELRYRRLEDKAKRTANIRKAAWNDFVKWHHYARKSTGLGQQEPQQLGPLQGTIYNLE